MAAQTGILWPIQPKAIQADESESAMKILLRKIEILNSSISYIDYESDIEISLTDVNSTMSGDLTENETNLEIMIRSRRTNIFNGWNHVSQ